jgi:hypothetical protein
VENRKLLAELHVRPLVRPYRFEPNPEYPVPLGFLATELGFRDSAVSDEWVQSRLKEIHQGELGSIHLRLEDLEPEEEGQLRAVFSRALLRPELNKARVHLMGLDHLYVGS